MRQIERIKDGSPKGRSKSNNNIQLTSLGMHVLAAGMEGEQGAEYNTFVYRAFQNMGKLCRELLTQRDTYLLELQEQRGERRAHVLERNEVAAEIMSITTKEAQASLSQADKHAYRKCYFPGFTSAKEAVCKVRGQPVLPKSMNIARQLSRYGNTADAFVKAHEGQLLRQAQAEIQAQPTVEAQKRKCRDICHDFHKKLATDRTFHISDNPLKQAACFILPSPVRRAIKAQ